ncbi:MAG TPA: hypothetical protein DCE41_33055 [Cytophagales bacterium]|nr:hypothetical protein [Cytophagales bacterium]HAA21413.1 hypothetical protein [Cytophagales bacterium]HAP59073.1 hypothetical protein [Cytophagales bacterium]
MQHTTLLFFLLASQFALAQPIQKISGTVIDEEFQQGIPGVHVSYNDGELGTVTNADGRFVLKYRGELEQLTFSHLGFQSLVIPGNEITPTLQVTLSSQTQQLQEVIIRDLSAAEVVKKAAQRLEDNHYVEPVEYTFHTQIMDFGLDSTLHLLEEYAGHVLHKKNHQSDIGLIKSRINAYSPKGQEDLKEHRLIAMSTMNWDNVVLSKEDCFRWRHRYKYTFTFGDNAMINDRLCYQIHYRTDSRAYPSKGTLFIDVEDFGIHRKVDGKSLTTEITCSRINGQYYLQSVTRINSRKEYHNVRNTLYNLSEVPTDGELVPLRSIMTDFSVEYMSDFTDAFWDEYNYQVLPDWVKNQME